MKPEARFSGVVLKMYIGRRRILSVEADLAALRERCGQVNDVLSSTLGFFADTTRWNGYSVAVLVRRHGALIGAVLFHARTINGVPTGVFTSGHLCGRGATIAAADDRFLVAELAARRLLRSYLAHTVAIRLPQDSGSPMAMPDFKSSSTDGSWLQQDARSCLSLADGMEGIMAGFSAKMRRNLRYYRRRAERDMNCEFLPQLTPSQSREAVIVLNGRSLFRRPNATAIKFEMELRSLPGSFAMGLRDGAGQWLSFMAGWRQPDGTYLQWQLNLSEPASNSLSTVMRSYFLEHEVNRGSPSIVFVGGTIPSWTRACAPATRFELHTTRKGVASSVVRFLGRRFRPQGLIAEVYG